MDGLSDRGSIPLRSTKKTDYFDTFCIKIIGLFLNKFRFVRVNEEPWALSTYYIGIVV